jgi:probable F420-dependent oxidoreductase
MRIGLKLPTSGPLARPGLIAELARTADRLGFSSLQVSDHVVIPATIDSAYPYNASGRMGTPPEAAYYEPIGLLGFLAGCTQHVRLGTSVLVLPYRHPVVVAKQLATIDSMSGGRLFLGIGTGWMEEEFKILGSPPYRERGAITDEYIAVFRTIWREPLPSFEGRFVSFPPLGAYPKPAQTAGIPIHVGGNTRVAIRRAVRLGDGWQPLRQTPAELGERLAYLREQAGIAGRDLSTFEISMGLGLRMTAGATERRESEANPQTSLVGPARELTQPLEVYAGLGVTEIAFDLRSCANEDEMRETVELCGEQLLPAVAGTTAGS